MRTGAFILLAVSLSASTLRASGDRPAPIVDRTRGAETIVVAKIIQVVPVIERNAFGDQVIVSHTLLQVEESLKGTAAPVIPLDVEGGTVAGLTMRASDMEPVSTGDRGVFFVSRSTSGANIPYLRHNGVVKLDDADHVKGTSVTLADVKLLVRQALR